MLACIMVLEILNTGESLHFLLCLFATEKAELRNFFSCGAQLTNWSILDIAKPTLDANFHIYI